MKVDCFELYVLCSICPSQSGGVQIVATEVSDNFWAAAAWKKWEPSSRGEIDHYTLRQGSRE